MNDKLVLIDGHSIINRAFYGVPDLTNKEGLHTNAIYGFLNIMFKILEEEKPTHLLVAFDVKAPTFRHKMYEAYKGTRKPMAEELRQQVPVMKEVLQAMNIAVVEQAGVEADDVLGTMARRGEKDGFLVTVVSGDRDLLQLATDKIKISVPKTKGGKTVTEDYFTKDVIEHYHVSPLQIIDLKGLMGDASDNIPGVPGIGEKTAVKILSQYETVENAIEHIDDMPKNKARQSLLDHQDLAVLSKVLATIKIDVTIDLGWDQAKVGQMFNDKAFALIQRLEFKSILSRFETSVGLDLTVEKRFHTVNTVAEAEKVFNQIKEKEEFGCRVVFLPESEENEDENGQFTLFSKPEEKETVLCVCIALKNPVEVFYFHINTELKSEYINGKIKEKIELGSLLIGCDIKSQLAFLPIEDSKQCFDVAVGGYVVDPIRNAYTEEDLAVVYTDVNMTSYQQIFGKKTQKEAAEMDKEEWVRYLSYCVFVTFLMKKNIEDALMETQSLSLYEQIEMPLLFTLYDMEQRGIQVEKDELKVYADQLGVRIQQLEKTIYEMAGQQFNINSPKQLGVVLFETMRLPGGKKTKTGYSTSADVLEKLQQEDPIIEQILQYRQLAKLKSTYADGLATYIREDGRIHSTFNQMIAATGRISSTEPNLQNIPIRMELGRKIRKVFVPKEGYVFLDADYSQIELRVLAHMAGDEHLIRAYSENADVHRTTASLVFHTPYEEVTDLQRSNAKAVNFGIVYGISGFGLSRDLQISKKQAQLYIDDYFGTYQDVKGFMEILVEKGKETGFVTTMFGRRRPIPELSSGNFMQRQFGERIAMNSPIQGTAADIIKIAMIGVNRVLKEKRLQSQLILQIHDELLIETKKEEVQIVERILQDEMENAVSLRVPLVAEVKQGLNWYEVK